MKYLYIPSIVYVYGAWILMHYASSNVYVLYCTPLSYHGFLTSPFTATLPHCQALRWIIYNSGDNITNMWVLLGAWLLLQIPLVTKTAG